MGWVATLLLALLHGPLLADEKAQRIIDKAVTAYGGEKLLQLKNIMLQDKLMHFSKWQSGHGLQGEMISYLSEQQIALKIDFVHQRKAFKRATLPIVGGHSSDSPEAIHRLFSQGKGYSIDHVLMQYTPSERISFENVDLGLSQQLDTLIVRNLHKDKQSSEWTDIAYIQGQAHDVISVHKGTKHEYVLYLNQQTGYLSRVFKTRNGQRVSYDFMDHQNSQGVVWAKRLFVGTEQGPLYHTDARTVKVNKLEHLSFNVPEGYRQRPKVSPVDVSTRTLRELGSGVYYVGKEWSYTLFVDVGEYVVSAGAWQMDADSKDWLSNVELFRQLTKNDKPIKQHLVTHHHTDHMMGLDDIVRQGSQLLVHTNDVTAVQAHLQHQLSAEQTKAITSYESLAGGKIQIYDVANSHANHNLVMYLPEHNLLFTEDMFGSSLQTGFDSPSRWPNSDTYHRLAELMKKVDEFGLEVSLFVSSHHARVLSLSEVKQAQAIQLVDKETLMHRLSMAT